jgi:mono/diheme cytochrome c family protein
MDIVLNTDPKRATAYLAIELPTEKWPALASQDGAQTAGPFYLIWKNPKSSQVGTEEWPYQLTGFEIKKSIQSLYPAIFPDSSLGKDHPVQKGFQVFLKNCFACHTLNRQGESSLGPDLNLPMSPTEYFTEKALLQFLRNPESIRSWPGQKMKGLSKEEVTDEDLKNLVEYLKQMASTRTGR